MEFLLIILAAIIFGYAVGIMQKGIHISIQNGPKPLVPKPDEQPQYNQDFSHMLPPDVQDYFQKNNGQIK